MEWPGQDNAKSHWSVGVIGPRVMGPRTALILLVPELDAPASSLWPEWCNIPTEERKIFPIQSAPENFLFFILVMSQRKYCI